MKIQLKGNRKLLILGAVIMTILVVEAAVLIALTVAYGKEHKRTNIQESAEVQGVLSEIQSEEVKALFFSMFSLASSEVDNFITHRGIHTVILEEALESGEEVLEFLELALGQEQRLEAVYIGLSMDESSSFEHASGAGLAQMFTDVCKWDDALLEIIKANPQVYFHLILEYPSAGDLAKMPELKRARLLKWYDDMSELFTPQEAYPNVVLFLPGAEEWLSGNQANYLDNGEPNSDAARFTTKLMICGYTYILDESNILEKRQIIEGLVAQSRAHETLDEEHTYVFFGDSVIGNYTDAMSIPGVVEGFTKAKVINCGYGGLHAAKADSESLSLTDVVDAFLEGKYAHFEDDKPVKSGILAFHEQLSGINQEKLTFFISIGLNDYMSGRPLTGNKANKKFHYEGAVRYAVDKLREAYPSSEIVLMTPNFIGLFEHGTETHNGYVLEDLVASVLELSTDLGVKCIDVFHGLDINAENQETYLADLCHPNEFGRYKVGRLVYEHLVKWSHEEETVEVSVEPKVEGYGVYADAVENLENNIFFDSLVYTGYNIEKHRSDGLMWYYVLAANKRGKGWLSDITYNGGSDGYEMTEEGLPDIEFFERNGLVCASYATYVYFNYLPNVAGIDTSELTRPEKAYNANDWYVAAKDWIEKGYSKMIDFEASLKGGFIDFEEAEEIPIGSIIAFCDSRNKSDYCSHIVIYAGYENDYHWVFHVGNENGPEFCSVERMHFGPDPQWPIAVITTPEQVIQQ